MQRTFRAPDFISKIKAASDVNLFGIDIETACAIGCTDECEHALDQNRNKITKIAVSNIETEAVFNNLEDFLTWLKPRRLNIGFTAHNIKFDFKVLIKHSNDPSLIDLAHHDSALLAFSFSDKIPDEYLEEYETKRRELNKSRKGHKHREAGRFSLKTLAPYFLNVEPFWEPEHGYDDAEYVLKDTRYAYLLTKYFLSKINERVYKFYTMYQLPWAKHLVSMELNGVTVDNPKLDSMWKETEALLSASEEAIKTQWSEYYDLWKQLQAKDINQVYNARIITKKHSAKQLARLEINRANALRKIQPLNLASPKQLSWLLKDQLGLDLTGIDEEDLSESTDKETLQRLSHINKDVERLLDYRKAQKLCSTYFPEYKHTYMINGKIHPTFNPIGARTGRLSCSDPNLQQVPGALHALFIAKNKYKLITRDLSAIEPTLLAYYSEDPELCRIMIEQSDFHGETAKAAFNLECAAKEVKKLYPKLRSIAKTIGLATLYGAGAKQVLYVLKKEGFADKTLSDAKNIVTSIREKYKGVWEFKKKLDAELEKGITLYNLLGRPVKIDNRDDVYMKGLNRLIQSSASDLMQEGALQVREKFNADVLLLVHDELVIEANENEADVLNEQITELFSNLIKLETAFGIIPVRTEGKVAEAWEK